MAIPYYHNSREHENGNGNGNGNDSPLTINNTNNTNNTNRKYDGIDAIEIPSLIEQCGEGIFISPFIQQACEYVEGFGLGKE